MSYRVSLHTTFNKIKKVSFFSVVASGVKIIGKLQKCIRPSKNIKITLIKELDSSIIIDCDFTFYSVSSYIKKQEIIKNKIQNAVNKLKLNKNVSDLSVSIFQENLSQPDFIITQNNVPQETKRSDKQTVTSNVSSYFSRINGKIMNWNPEKKQLEIFNDSFGTVLAEYKNIEEDHDFISKSYNENKEISLFGNINIGVPNFLTIKKITSVDIHSIAAVFIPKFKRVNFFSRCQK